MNQEPWTKPKRNAQGIIQEVVLLLVGMQTSTATMENSVEIP